MNNLNELYKKYDWLKIKTTIKDYVEPEYYNRILKPYIFNGKSDEELFINYVIKIGKIKFNNTLELGCGTGRITEIFLKNFSNNTVDLVDFSSKMLSFSMKKFGNYDNLSFIESDSIKFLENCKRKYDFIYSLWSFSHSVHQILSELGLNHGITYVTKVLKKMFIENLNEGGYVFLIHFDSLSDEQRILMRQWRKVFPIFSDLENQSPSKLLIDQILCDLKDEGHISFTQEHKKGEEIIYKNLEEALEIFMNFHMESFFNEDEILLGSVVTELIEYFDKFKKENGTIYIKPGCFIYKIKKIGKKL